ncbi:antibiotic biosynthesis monooxygenase [Curvibacter sp. APW13]|uniref:antibiotic biosynthesis monooxygenase family protein n=1 Tax=Curvibacter sp. APW13 TaxID=3077236 RepID=UPI0028DE7963|nr:antibiotic biosynthesis monooxygenase [Curvibacter sp. APW13]MDT8992052.1 antibiotic biosynthesis monooxygenase [Curvibacter sp. APW13]
MILRIWKVGLAPGQASALERFAHDVSLPMFRAQSGCLAVFFTRSDTACVTVTVWESTQAVERMEASERYQSVVAAIEQTGILCGHHQTDTFAVYGGAVDAALAQHMAP